MTAFLTIALLCSLVVLVLQRREIKALEAEHDRLCDLLMGERP